MSLPQSIAEIVQKAHEQKKTIVFVSGVFDLLHQEHKHFLQNAAKLGDMLIVGLESDVRVKKLKGPDRPIWNQQTRLAELEKLPEVTVAFILPEVFDKPIHHQQLIEAIWPKYLAVSSHSPHQKEKQKIMDLVNGEVKVVLDHNPAISTTSLINNLTDR